MTERSTTPQAASRIDADVDDAQTSVTGIDDLIVQLRAAHDRGTTIEELHAHLRPIIDRGDVGPLLELEPPTAEKAGENSTASEDARDDPRCNPLLGTISTKALKALVEIENIGNFTAA